MNIGIEARWMAMQKTGFGNYIYNLVKELSIIDNTNQYYIFSNKDLNNNYISEKGNFNELIIRKSPAIYKHLYIPLSVIKKKVRVDFLHYAYNAPSLINPYPFIITIHDVSYKNIPQMISLKHRFSLYFQLYLNAKKAKKIIAVSNNTKKDIIKFFKVPGEKICVIYEGVASHFKSVESKTLENRIKKKYDIPGKYILYVGTYAPHKNLDTLILAYKNLVGKSPDMPYLVLAGSKGRNYDRIKNLVEQNLLNKKVRRIGFVDDNDLPTLYSHAELFVFPSLYEGFGLPLLEAMACGTAVICSDQSSLTEIGGDAALYFSAKNVEHLVMQMMTVLKKKDINESLVSKGIKRVKYFSWRKMAEKTLFEYENVFALL